MVGFEMLNVTLFTRKNCSPCNEVKQELGRLQGKYPHRLVEVDIDSDDVLRAKYGTQVPVLEAGPYTLKAPITSQSLQMTLGAAIDRKTQLEQVGDKEYQMRLAKGQRVSFGDRLSLGIAKKYLLFLNLFILLYGGLPFMAPVFMNAGLEMPARAIYRIYKPLCHQFGFRSFFLFGEQTFYPLEQAGLTGLKNFEQVSGIPDLDNPYSSTRLEARQYVGEEGVGFKVALCERDIAIYASILAFGLLFGSTGRRIKSLHWTIWLAIGLVPISLDGFSQLFSQFNWDWLASIVPYRESTPFLRIMTGALFGFTTAWFAYPGIEESMNETRQYYIKKFAVHQASS
jgi:uncharacterized membrane protein